MKVKELKQSLIDRGLPCFEEEKWHKAKLHLWLAKRLKIPAQKAHIPLFAPSMCLLAIQVSYMRLLKK